MTESQLCEVYSAADTPEAYFIKASLEDAGIEARVVGDLLQNAVGDLPAVAIAPRVWVWEKDLEPARGIIENHRAQCDDPNRPTARWECNSCGELNEPTFDFCWNCQAPNAPM